MMKEYLLLWVLIPVSLFMVVWFASRSVTIATPHELQEEIIDSLTTLLPSSSQKTKLYAGWDIMLSRGVWYYNKQDNRFMMFSWSAYNPIHEWCQDNCFLIFNLESLFSTIPNDSPDSTFHFAANTRNIDIVHRMKGLNELYLSLANNHARNVGKNGVMFTRAFLDQEDIAYGGASEDTDTYGYNVTITDRDGIRICLASYSYDGKTIGQWIHQYTIEKLEIWRIQRDVSYMREQDCDVKVANLHRGREYDIAPTPEQTILAREIIDSGIDLILWNHSHVPGFIEQYQGKYIIYSMGNHIFDQDRWYKNCERWKYDVIYDYQLDRCTVPTYIGMNLGFKIEKDKDIVTIDLDHINFFGIKRWIQYQLDEKTKEELKREIIQY